MMPDSLRFDPTNQSLHTTEGTIQLAPKAFAMLAYLHQRPQQLVTKEELLTAIWPNVFVTDAVLKVTIGELRKALEDDAKTPRYIETVHRRGYRFIGDIRQVDEQALKSAPQSIETTISPQVVQQSHLLGRTAELNALQSAWQKSQTGQRQVLVLQAEAGFGKTALLNTWLASLAPQNLVIIKAQCLDQYGQTEAYQPFLDALTELLQGEYAAPIAKLIQQYAPVWWLQLPQAYRTADTTPLEPFGATAGRMLREFADFIEQLSKYWPIIWVLEDLHWSDAASIELVATLAARQQNARLLLLASLRASHLNQQARLKQVVGELASTQKIQTLNLSPLQQTDLTAYLSEHLPPALQTPWALDLFVQYTEGNPLFVFTALEHIRKTWQTQPQPEISQTWLAQCISGGLKSLLEFKLASLTPLEVNLLQAASIAINRSTSEGCAAVLAQDVLTTEDQYQTLVQKELWLVATGEQTWPDGSICETYRFRHKLYQDFIYQTLSAARRRHYHLRLANRLQQAYQAHSAEIANKLAYHFEQGGDLAQAIPHLQQASRIASQRFAYVEVLQQLDHILALQEQLSAYPYTKLDLLEQRCNVLLASGSLAQAIPAYQQLLAASETLSPKHQVRGLLGLAGALFWIDRQQCLNLGQQAVALCQTLNDPQLTTHARGKWVHWQSIIQGYRPEYQADYENALQLARQTEDAVLKCTHSLLYIYYLIITSRYQQADALALETQQFAQAAGDANSYLASVFFQAWAHFYRGNWEGMAELINTALALAEKNAQVHWLTHFSLQKAWLLIHQAKYATAQALVEPIHQQSKLASFKTSAYFFSLINLIHLQTQQQNVASAQVYVDEINSYLLSDASAIDWVLKLPLYQGIAEFYLQTNQLEPAQQAIQSLNHLAQQSHEITYLHLAKLLTVQYLQKLGRTAEAELQEQQLEAEIQAHPNALLRHKLQAKLG